MGKYEQLLDEAYDLNLKVFENCKFKSNADALINDDRIALSEKLDTTIKKSCALAEEIAHFKYSSGNIIDLRDIRSSREEYRARKQTVFETMPIESIIEAFEYGVTDMYELIDYLEVTEKFFEEGIDIYKKHFGLNVVIGDYFITFEPLQVGKRL